MNAPTKINTTLGASSPREIRDWRTVRLFDLKNDREFASRWFQHGYYCTEGAWSWMKDVVAEKFGCDPDDVDIQEADWESENPRDLITVNGVAVAYEGRNR